MKDKTNIDELFHNARCEGRYLKVSAPMVRYSKLQFRKLVRKYGVDISFTPMIMADSFCQSSYARSNEFTTSTKDTPLIVQFAAKNIDNFIGASQLVYPFADGVDLNCGCPQRWAIKDGYGCAMLNMPENIYCLVREFKNSLPSSFSVSVKVRLLKDLKKTIDLCRQIEKCGVNFITVHGRTPSQRSSEDIDIESLSQVCKCLQIPMIANGGVKTLTDADNLYTAVNCEGVMSASGILTNPALFTGAVKTPVSCVQDWLDLCTMERDRMTFQCFHHHLVFMLEKTLSKKQKQTFNYFTNYEDVENYLKMLDISNRNLLDYNDDLEIICEYSEKFITQYSKKKCSNCRQRICQCNDASLYNSTKSDGKYFSSLVSKSVCDLDYMDSTIFEE